MRYSIIENNVVVRCIEAASQKIANLSLSDGMIAIQSDVANIGWVYDEELGLRANPAPSYDPIVETAVLTQEDGKVPVWSVVPKYDTIEEENEAKQKHKEKLLESVRSECRNQIIFVNGWTGDIQANVDGGRSDSRLKPLMDDAINSLRAESNRCEDLIAQGLDYTSNWPKVTSYAEAKEALA